MKIYKWTNKINGKIYVGKTTQTIAKRIKGYNRDVRSYINGTYKYQYPIVRAMAKYGIDNFIFEVIDETLTNEDLNVKEIEWILKLDCRNPDIGYNVSKGGDDGWFNMKHTQETKDKISNHKKTMGAWKGQKNPKYKLSEQNKKDIVDMYKSGSKTKELALKFDVHLSQICRVLKSAEITVPKPNSKINQDIADQIRKEYVPNVFTRKMLAEKFGIKVPTIDCILNNKTWTKE